MSIPRLTIRGINALERTRDNRAPSGKHAPSFVSFASAFTSSSFSISMSGGVFGSISLASSSPSSSSGSNVNASLLDLSQLNIVAINANRPCNDDVIVEVLERDISSNAHVVSHKSPRAFSFSSPKILCVQTTLLAEELLLYSPSSIAAMANAADEAALSSP